MRCRLRTAAANIVPNSLQNGGESKESEFLKKRDKKFHQFILILPKCLKEDVFRAQVEQLSFGLFGAFQKHYLALL